MWIVWETLIPVVVGGGIAAVGGIVAPTVSKWLDNRAERRKRRAEKFEEMINTLYENDDWLDELRGIRAFGNQRAERACPLPRGQTIAALYFPALIGEFDKVEVEGRKYIMWMNEAAKKRLGGKLNELNDGLEAAYKPYRVQFVSTLNVLRDYAKTELQ